MALNLKDLSTLVRDGVTAAQASSRQALDFTIGSILRALFESVAALALWLQGLIVQLLATTRAATATGADLDTWIADYGMTPRIAAIAATGSVTFARFTSTNAALVPVGALIKTADGTQSFAVTVDKGNPAYSAALAGYQIAAGVASITVPVAALTGGAAGNIAANTLTALAQPIQYVDTVTNSAAFINGANAETDVQLRARFVAYVASLAKATRAAVSYAISSAYPNASFTITENVQYGGAVDNGYFYVVADDGSGNPPSTFLSSVAGAVETARPLAIRYGVFGPTLVSVPVTLTATIAAGFDPVATKALIQTAIQNYVNGLGLGNTLYYTRLLQVAYDASPGVVNIANLLVNSGTADVTASTKQIIKYSTVTVS